MGIFLWAVMTVETYDCKISKRQSRYHFRSSWLAKNTLFLEKNSPWTHTDRALKYSVQHRFLPIREKKVKKPLLVFARCGAAKSPNGVDDRGHPSERPTPLVRRTTPGEATWAFETRSGAWLRRSPRRRPRSRGTANRAPRTFLAQGGGATISSGRFAPRVAAHAGASRPVRSFAASADCEYPRFVP